MLERDLRSNQVRQEEESAAHKREVSKLKSMRETDSDARDILESDVIKLKSRCAELDQERIKLKSEAAALKSKSSELESKV
jgi:hypothetical protein